MNSEKRFLKHFKSLSSAKESKSEAFHNKPNAIWDSRFKSLQIIIKEIEKAVARGLPRVTIPYSELIKDAPDHPFNYEYFEGILQNKGYTVWKKKDGILNTISISWGNSKD